MKNLLLVVCLLVTSSYCLNGQLTLENSFSTKHSYEQKVKTRFYVDNLNQMDVQEQLRFRPSEEVKQISIYADDGGQKEIEIVHLQHNSLAPDWLAQPQKTIMNGAKIYSLDENGEIYVELPHSEKTIANYNEFSPESKANFKGVSETDIAQLTASGYGVTYLTPTRIQISSDRALMTVDESELYFAIEILDTEGISLSHTETWYQDLGDEIVPIRKNMYSRVNTKQGSCATKLISYDYTQYTVERNRGEQPRIASDLFDSMEIFPNPVNDQVLTLRLGQFSYEDLQQIEMYDGSGKSHAISYSQIGSNQIQLAANNAKDGVYFLKITLRNKVYSKKVIFQNK